MWPVDVICAHSDQRQFEATPVCADHHLCCRLAGRVGICGCKYACLTQICCTYRHVSVHLICGNVYKATNTMLPCSFKQDMCAVYIGVRELIRVAKAQIDVRLRRKVEDGIDLMLSKHSLNVARQCDIAMFKDKIRPVVEHSCVVQGRAVVELIERDHIVVRIGEHDMTYEPTCSVHCQRLVATTGCVA